MNYRLQIIFPEGKSWRSKKVRYCDAGRIPCQIGRGEYSSSRHAGVGLRHQISTFWQRHGGQVFTHAFGECRLPKNEHGHIRAKRQGQRHELAARQPRPPQFVQGDQHGRGVTGTAPQAAALRNAFFQCNLRALARARGALQRMGRAQRQVIDFGNAGQCRRPADDAVGAYLEMQRVAQVDETEDRLQQVIAVGAATHHVQEQIQFGGSRNVVQSHRRPPVRDILTF